MVDNIDVSVGSGKTIAADEVAGVLHQRVKISQGADGVATDVSSAAPLNVTVANTGANTTAIKVDASSVAVPVTDNGATLSIDDGASTISIDDGGGSITVDVGAVVADPFGANADAASATGSISAKLKAIATALGTTAFDLGSGTGGTRTLRVALDTATDVATDATLGTLAVEQGGNLDAISSNLSGMATDIATLASGNIAPGLAGTASADVVSIQGVSSHDAVDADNSVKIGAKAIAGLSGATLVSAADRTNLYSGLDGALITRPHCGLEDLVRGTTTITASTVAVIGLSSVASVKQYVTHISASNASTQACQLGLIDATTPAIMTFPVPANYSGFISNFQVPIAPAAAGTKWAVQSDSSLATVTVNIAGFKSKV